MALPTKQSRRIYCRYVNDTQQVQIVRITNVADWYFERVVFPRQCLLFETWSNARLEIHTYTQPSATLSDEIPCDRLRISSISQSGIHGVSQQLCGSIGSACLVPSG